jgi:UDP-N-acetylglucosamine 1-carboxyvinyltransferase
MPRFIVEGGHPLKGTVKIHGSKNAALPILAATLLTKDECTLRNVPNISDIHAFLEILQGLGAKFEYNQGTLKIQTVKVGTIQAQKELVQQMRASILLLGPLLARKGEAEMVFPGGCVLGKRSIHAHTHALEKLGAQIEDTEDGIRATAKTLHGTKIIMAESSVTATENAIMAAVLAENTTKIHWAAMEPHVQDLCHFLNSMGAQIRGIGTHTLFIEGVSHLHGTDYEITSDYLEAGTLALAAVLTRGTVTLENIIPDHLDSFWQKLDEVGANFELHETSAIFKPLKTKHFQPVEQLKTAVFPGFATDLQAPFTVLLTQADGESKMFETLFDGRLNYLYELEKMGAKVAIHNSHQATINGPTPLRGTRIVSCDIRAGAAMVLAALTAEGTTEISDIRYIERGYENLHKTLNNLGAKITRKKAQTP